MLLYFSYLEIKPKIIFLIVSCMVVCVSFKINYDSNIKPLEYIENVTENVAENRKVIQTTTEKNNVEDYFLVDETTTEKPEYNQNYYQYLPITAYCGCETCCGEWSKNRDKDENGNDIVCGASGRELIEGYSCASWHFPLGTIIEIEGLGIFRVDDRGSSGIDIYFNTHEDALRFGKRYSKVSVLQ